MVLFAQRRLTSRVFCQVLELISLKTNTKLFYKVGVCVCVWGGGDMFV